MPVTLALSLLCENPLRRTGLSTLFHEFVKHALELYPDVRWLLYAGPEQPWTLADERVQVVRSYPANDHRLSRLLADHFRVGPDARRRGAQALLTIGFVPARAPLPVAMHVFSVHHLAGGGGLRGAYRRRALRHGLQRASWVIANSQWTADQIAGLGVARARPLLVSPEGLQHERFHPRPDPALLVAARAALSLPPQYLLWSSNFYAYKRADRALAAYAALSPELRRAYPFVLVGGDWEGGLAAAKAEAQRLRIDGSTRFLGWIEDRWLPACYQAATGLLLSTTEETFGRSVLEALGCGCPCILQDLPVLREVAGDAARYVDYADASAAAAEITRLCEDPALRAERVQSGIQRAATFTFERLARERVGAILAGL